MSLLRIENLSVEVEGKRVLKKVNLEMKKGEVHVLLGANASGKSTLLHSIMGFPEYEVKEGRIVFAGEDITDFNIEDRARKGIAVAFQNPPNVSLKLSKQ